MPEERITNAGARLLHALAREGAWLDQTERWGFVTMPTHNRAKRQVAEYLLRLGLLEPYHKGERGWRLNAAGRTAVVTHRKPQ